MLAKIGSFVHSNLVLAKEPVTFPTDHHKNMNDFFESLHN